MTRPDLRTRLQIALAREAGGSSDFDLNRDTVPVELASLRGAGVLVAVRPDPDRVILTKRASHLSQHPGQIAFPGGKIEPSDRDAEAAALREAHEEIGLAPTAVDVLGQLPPHVTVTGYSVTPILSLVAGPFRAVPERSEVAEVFEVPLDVLADPANYRLQCRPWRGIERRYYTVPWGPYYIWGATARILRGLATRMAE